MASSIPCLRCRATAQAEANAQAVSCPSCSLALPPPASPAWLVSRAGGQPFGPYTIDQLAGHIATGMVVATDSLWHEGAPGWVGVSELPALAGGAPVPPPTPPQPPQPAAGAADPAYGGQPYGGPAYGQPADPAYGAQAYGGQPQPGAYGGQPYGGHPGQPPYGQPGFGDPNNPYGPGPYGAAPSFLGSGGFGLHFKRAVDWNLSRIEMLPDERAQLLANGVDDDNAGRFLLWRRSVLIAVAPITAFSVFLALLSIVTGDRAWTQYSAFGIIVDILRLASLFALPVAAFMAAKIWYRQRRSRNILLIGFAVAFATPLVLGLIPYGWLLNMNNVVDPMQRMQAAAAAQGAGAIIVYITLMPAVLSLIPGVLRACLRIKALLPEATLPGWFLVSATPLYILLFLVIFSVINQLAGHFLLILGVLALLVAPVLYVLNAKTFTSPLRSPPEVAKIGSVQNMAIIIALVGTVLLVLWTFVGQIGANGPTLLGFSPPNQMTGDGSILRPWNPRVLQFPVDFLGRSLFTTVVVADLIMQMNVSMWRHDKQSEGVAEAAHYDRMMGEIEEAGMKTEMRPPQGY